MKLCLVFAIFAVFVAVSAAFPGPSDPFGSVSSRCTVRPETSAAIERLRAGAAKMSAGVQQEMAASEQRKRHIAAEQLALNERIRALNAVKAQLSESLSWIETTQERLDAIEQQEKVLTNRDILDCLEREKSNFAAEKEAREHAIRALMESTREAEGRLGGGGRGFR